MLFHFFLFFGGASTQHVAPPPRLDSKKRKRKNIKNGYKIHWIPILGCHIVAVSKLYLLHCMHVCLTHTHTAPIVYKPAALKTKHACNLPRMQPAQHAPLPCYNPPKAPPHHRSPVTTYPPLLSYPLDQRHPIFTTLDGSDQTRVTATLYVSTSPRHVSHITTPLPHVSNIPTHLKPAAHVEEYV